MQTDEGIPNPVQRTTGSVDTSPIDLENLLPGSTGGDMLPGAYRSRESLASELDAVENVAADIERNTKMAVVNGVNDVAVGVEAIKANAIGRINNQLDAAGKVVDKLADKQLSKVRNGLMGVYADAVRIGIPVPTMEQVQYALGTGDYIGSMGLPDADEPSERVYLDVLPQPGPQPIPIERLPELPTDCPPGTMPRYIVDKSSGTPVVTGVECTPVNLDGNQVSSDSCPTRPVGATHAIDHVLCLNPATGVISEYPGQVCPVGMIATCWDKYGGGVPGALSPTNRLCDCWQVPTQPPQQPAQPPPTQPPPEFYDQTDQCPEGYYSYDWDGVSPLPYGAIRVGNLICIPHPAEQITKCKVADLLECYTPPKFPEIPATAEGDDYCKSLRDFSEGFIAAPSHFADFIAVKSAGANESTIGKAVARALTGNDGPIVASTINSLGRWLQDAFNFVVKSVTCNRVALTPIATVHAIIKFLNQWFAIAPQAALNTMQQAENMTCQTKMPDQPSTDKAYLSDVIDRDLWECWTKINGDVVAAAEKGLEVLRTRPTSEQVSKLFRRKQLTRDEFEKRMRQNGVIHDADREAIHNLTQDWPSLSDLTPWIVRDVFDETTIDWKEVDRLFEAKYTDESKKYFDAIGLTKDVVKYYWRAHFHLPSFTMASEMYHRFRWLDENDPLYTGIEEVKALLIQDDWHPDWVDRMLAITFRPMRLIDIRTAYDMRIIDDEGLKDKLRILGYSDSDVDTTFAQWNKRRDINDARKGGFPSVKQLISQYANCEIDDHTFRYQLSFVVESEQQESKAVEAAEIARQSESNRRTIAGISWQFRRGLISEEEATAELSRQGIDPTCVPSLVRVWKSQTAKQPKQLAAGSLCKMLEQGVINQSEFVNALLRIGYTSIDADRVMRSCAVGLTQKEMRRANQEAARLARERKAAEKEAAKLRRLEECGPPPCPKNRQTESRNGEAGPSSPVTL